MLSVLSVAPVSPVKTRPRRRLPDVGVRLLRIVQPEAEREHLAVGRVVVELEDGARLPEIVRKRVRAEAQGLERRGVDGHDGGPVAPGLLERREEEGLVFRDGARQEGARDPLIEGGLGARRERVARGQAIGPVVRRRPPVKVVPARAGDDVDDRAGGLTVLSRVRAREDLVFRDRIGGVVAAGAPERILVVGHAVGEKRVARSGAAGARDRAAIRHARGDPGGQEGEALEVALGQRELVDLLPRDRWPRSSSSSFRRPGPLPRRSPSRPRRRP